ncbi:hypothetical protein AB0D65_29530 [Streptomyces griseoloalbus]|uniref:Uncharacterized protein n=1 Tax=Streptomyces griseoloalbus TaxID=67303 RepID=A0ABV3ED02_9ACTN
MTAVDAPTALTFYEFIEARLDEELRAKYPTADSTPAVEEYREKFRAAKKEHGDLVDALHRGDEEQAADLKRIPRGWAAAEGHGGGHFWQAPEVAELKARGAHYDPGMLLSGQPTPWHLPEDCAPGCWQWRD